MKPRHLALWIFSTLAVSGATALITERVRAAGIPESGVLTYSGYLEEPDGTAVTGTKNIAVLVFTAEVDGDKVCESQSTAVTVSAGRFQIPLPDACVTAVNEHPDLWLDVQVDGASLGRSKLGAVPYAVEAAHATRADHATTANGPMVAPYFFAWDRVVAAASGVETPTTEGLQTVTFDTPGYYRITLNVQAIHDEGTRSSISWLLGGTAQRLDNLSQEAGGRDVKFSQAGDDSRQVASTVLFVEAAAGETLTINPVLNVEFSAGNFHQANFMFASEYLGPL